MFLSKRLVCIPRPDGFVHRLCFHFFLKNSFLSQPGNKQNSEFETSSSKKNVAPLPQQFMSKLRTQNKVCQSRVVGEVRIFSSEDKECLKKIGAPATAERRVLR